MNLGAWFMPNSFSVTYGYNANNRMTTVTGDTGSTTYDYNNMNQITSVSYPNGVLVSKTYDPINYYLTEISSQVSGAATLLDDIQYTYDPVGNRKTKTNALGTYIYNYDGIYQLKDVNGPDGYQHYTYDGAGNRIKLVEGKKGSASGFIYSYDAANQLVTVAGKASTVALMYDGAGNLSSKGATQYVWDNFNRLTDLVTMGGPPVVSYRYDAMGRRGWKTVESTGAWRYVYDGDEVVAEFVNGNPITPPYTLYTVGPEGVISGRASGGMTVYYQYDGLGSVSKVTDPSGNLVTSYSYDAFGKTTMDPENPYRFVGGPGVRTDDESGLMYMRARYYDPIVGRFISRDPIGIRGGLNLYGYVGNNPINLIDPLGLMWIYNGRYLYHVNNKTKKIDGKWRAKSGNSKHKPLPKGPYTISSPAERDDQPGMEDPSGFEWSANLTPGFDTDRTNLEIHPDGPPPGTLGCIGVEGNDTHGLFNALNSTISKGDNALLVK